VLETATRESRNRYEPGACARHSKGARDQLGISRGHCVGTETCCAFIRTRCVGLSKPPPPRVATEQSTELDTSTGTGIASVRSCTSDNRAHAAAQGRVRDSEHTHSTKTHQFAFTSPRGLERPFDLRTCYAPWPVFRDVTDGPLICSTTSMLTTDGRLSTGYLDRYSRERPNTSVANGVPKHTDRQLARGYPVSRMSERFLPRKDYSRHLSFRGSERDARGGKRPDPASRETTTQQSAAAHGACSAAREPLRTRPISQDTLSKSHRQQSRAPLQGGNLPSSARAVL